MSEHIEKWCDKRPCTICGRGDCRTPNMQFLGHLRNRCNRCGEWVTIPLAEHLERDCPKRFAPDWSNDESTAEDAEYPLHAWSGEHYRRCLTCDEYVLNSPSRLLAHASVCDVVADQLKGVETWLFNSAAVLARGFIEEGINAEPVAIARLAARMADHFECSKAPAVGHPWSHYRYRQCADCGTYVRDRSDVLSQHLLTCTERGI